MLGFSITFPMNLPFIVSINTQFSEQTQRSYVQRRRSGSSTASVRFRPNCTHSAANGLNASLPTVRANTERVSMKDTHRKRSYGRLG